MAVATSSAMLPAGQLRFVSRRTQIPTSRRCLTVRVRASGNDDNAGAQSKGFGAPTPKPPTPSTSPSKASMEQYRKVLAAEQEAKARREAAATPSTSGRATPSLPSAPIVETPVVVSDRMLQRMILFSGAPVFLGLALYPLFYYLKKVQGIDLPMWVVYVTQLFTFGGGLAGITYAVMSTSWDPAQPGSLLGWTEFQGNLPLLLDRFRKK